MWRRIEPIFATPLICLRSCRAWTVDPFRTDGRTAARLTNKRPDAFCLCHGMAEIKKAPPSTRAGGAVSSALSLNLPLNACDRHIPRGRGSRRGRSSGHISRLVVVALFVILLVVLDFVMFLLVVFVTLLVMVFIPVVRPGRRTISWETPNPRISRPCESDSMVIPPSPTLASD